MSFIINPYAFGAGGGGGITTPSDLADIWEWWEPSRNGLTPDAAISSMAGQFAPGSGHDWTQGTGSLQPIFKDSIVNGLGVARFDGTDDDMSSVNPTALTAVHFFAVIKMDSNTPAAGKSGLWSFGQAGGAAYPLNSPATDIGCDSFRTSSQQFSKSGIDVSQWRVLEIISTSGEWTFKLDGTQLTTTAGAFAHQSSGFIRLGRSGPFDGNYLDGDLAGMYICSAKLTTDRTAMINYLNSRFGLSAS